MRGTAPSRAHRRRPLQSVPSPLPQIPPCPNFSLGEGMLQPAPTRCPCSCTTQPTQPRGSCGRERAAAHHGSSTASGRAPATALPPRAAPWVSGRERRRIAPPGADPANRGRAAPGTHPEPCGRREPGAAQSPEPCPRPRPRLQPGTCLYPTPCPQHTALSMPYLMLCCPEGVCLSFPRQSSAGCAQGPHPRPQSQPPRGGAGKWVNGEAQPHKSH